MFGSISDEMQRYKRQSIEEKELRVFHSDPLDYHSILDALKGCCALFYSFELPSDHPTYDVSSVHLSVFSFLFHGFTYLLPNLRLFLRENWRERGELGGLFLAY